jgi:glyoxylase-like metal-dependent hydrolase (beta-lactamase superfamily II)
MEKIRDIYFIEGFGADSNCYLVDNILIDTGTGLNETFLHKNLTDFGFKVEDIETIVNTHSHYDHTGGNFLFPDAKIAIHEKDAKAVENEDDPLTAGFIFNQSLKRHDVHIKLKEGDKIGNFEVIHTPGHTPGGICLWNGEILISGDTVFANGGFGRLDIGGNHENMANSLKRLKKLDVKYLCPGHGNWTLDGKKHIEFANKTFFGMI